MDLINKTMMTMGLKNDPSDPNGTSMSQAVLLVVGVYSGYLAIIPVAFFVSIWFFVSVFITEELDEGIIDTLTNGSSFMLGSKIGLGIAVLVYSVINITYAIPIVIALMLLNLLLKKI